MGEDEAPRLSSRRSVLAGATAAVGAGLFGGASPAQAAAGDYATLGADGKLPVEQLPDRVLTRFGERPVGEKALVFNVNDYVDSLDASLDKPERDTRAWEAALADAASAAGGRGNRYAVVVAPGGDFHITRTLIWNTRVSIDGHCEITSQVPNDANGMPRFLWQTHCDDQTTGYWLTRQHATVFSNIVCAADEYIDDVTRSNGILIEHIDEVGSTEVRRPAYLTFRNTTWRNFSTAVTFGQHAYMIGFHSSSIQGNVIGVRAKPPDAGKEAAWNSGERLLFEDCDLTSNSLTGFSIEYDQGLHFAQCSFDQFGDYDASAGIIARGQAYLTNCHLEMWGPNSTPDPAAEKRGRPWFDLTGFGAHLQLTDCRLLVRARENVTGAADTGLIRFSSVPPSKGQRAVIRGGHIHGNATTLEYLATGNGRLTVSETSTFSGTTLRPHANELDSLLRDGIAGLTKIFDDWVVAPASVDTITPGPFPGFGAGPDGRAFKLTHKTRGAASNIYLFVPIQPAARALVTLEWAVPDSVSAAAIFVGYATGRRVDGSGEWEGGATVSRAAAPGRWASMVLPQKYTKPAPGWAVYLALRVDVTQVNSGASVYLRDIRISQF